MAIELTVGELNSVSGGSDLITAFVQGFNKGLTESSLPPPPRQTSHPGGPSAADGLTCFPN
jgi:hypothetical protein